MYVDVLIVSAFIGIAIAAPIGPINLIVLRSALTRGFAGGVLAGIGSVIGDGIFASVAAFGVRQIQEFVLAHTTALGTLGGLMLVLLGIKTSRGHVDMDQLAAAAGPISKTTASRKILSTLALTVTNPATLMGMLAIFGTMGTALKLTTAPSRAFASVLGVMLGSLLWWVFLAALVSVLRNRLTSVWLDRLNRWAGVLIAALGFVFLFDALQPLWR